jgi:Zn-dependent metalloprotease
LGLSITSIIRRTGQYLLKIPCTVFHTKDGVLKSLSGIIVTDFDQAMDRRAAKKLSDDQAIGIAVKYVNAKQYAWQDAGMEQSIKDQFKDSKASYKPSANLVWYSSKESLNPRELRLCYKIDIYATQPRSRAYYFVDALTGNVLGKKDRIFTTDAEGTAATAYSGSQTIHSDFTGSNYRLSDYTKGSGIITLHGETGKLDADYTSASADWTLAGTNIAALDAHYGVSQTYAYYYSHFSRNSYDGAGAAMYSRVNASGCDSAFWDGTRITFLTRCDATPGGVTGIDVCGHEFTHAVTEHSSGLIYSNESGAMNESMSDIFGKTVQFWSKPTDVDWRFSNDMGWNTRDMSNPNADLQPDTYLGTYWYTGNDDNGGYIPIAV